MGRIRIEKNWTCVFTFQTCYRVQSKMNGFRAETKNLKRLTLNFFAFFCRNSCKNEIPISANILFTAFENAKYLHKIAKCTSTG